MFVDIIMLGSILLLLRKFCCKKMTGDNNIILSQDIFYPTNLNFLEKKLFTKLYKDFYFRDLTPLPVIWAILWTESGSFIVDEIPNSEVIGDDGKSIGYFQINIYGALKDYNQTFKTNYGRNDLKNYELNKTIGLWYIGKCYKSALSQSVNKPVEWLTFKKYNGGVDETETSKNTMATNYADKTYSRFLKLKNFYQLNL